MKKVQHANMKIQKKIKNEFIFKGEILKEVKHE